MAGGSKSKNKGSNAERELCKILTDTFGQKFVRAALSGAWLGGKNIHRKTGLSAGQVASMKSDISPPDSLRHLVIESKFYSSFLFHQLLTNENKQLDEWIKEVLVGAEPHETWLIAMKFNRLGWYICIPYDEAYEKKSYTIYDSTKYGKMLICQLEEFLLSNKNILEVSKQI